MGNSAYLKKYVENHPNNKMAWYLLGKEYEANGQAGKAHYCYIQAGNVYEAFESSKIPLPEEVLAGYKEGLLQESHRKEKRSRFLRKLSLALLIALLVWIPSAHAPGDRQAAVPVNAADAGAGDDADLGEASAEAQKPAGDEAGEGAPAGTPAFSEPAFTAIGFGGDPAGTQAEALGGLLALQRQTAVPCSMPQRWAWSRLATGWSGRTTCPSRLAWSRVRPMVGRRSKPMMRARANARRRIRPRCRSARGSGSRSRNRWACLPRR